MSSYAVPLCPLCSMNDDDVYAVAENKPCIRCGQLTTKRTRAVEMDRRTDIANLAADLMRIVVNANLGIPGKPGGEVARQLVRECRALYEEVDKPTAPPRQRIGQQSRAARTVDDDGDGDAERVSDTLDDFAEGEIDE